jgi:hypothetical protein
MLTTNFSSPNKVTFTWLIFWLVVMGFMSIILKNLGINYNDSFILCSVYFTSFSFIGMKTFNSLGIIKKRFKNSNYISLFLLTSIGYFFITMGIEFYIPLKVSQAEMIKDIGLMFALFNIPTFIAKFTEIMFQQILILTLVLGLERSGLPHKKNISIFTIAFLSLHLPLIFIFGVYGLLFIIPSSLAGLTFSFLILKYPNGHLYSILVHQAFYIVLGTALRFYL